MDLNLKRGQRKKNHCPWSMVSHTFHQCAVFWDWTTRERLLENLWVKYIILGRVRKQKDVKTPNPYPILALWFLEWSLVELQVESENLTQILGWVVDSVHGGCTCLYLSVMSADLQRHATLSASWRWLKMHQWKINLLLPFGHRGARCSGEILAELWPSWDA